MVFDPIGLNGLEGVIRYMRPWVNRRTRRTLNGNRSKYLWYYRQSWSRYCFNNVGSEVPTATITITTGNV